jgi:hypothetical protein
MSWFRITSIYTFICGVAFFFFPRLSNEIFGINYGVSLHGEDWLRLFGLTGFSFAYLSNAAHSSAEEQIKRIITCSLLIFYVPCA